jgi:hypothetical protein
MIDGNCIWCGDTRTQKLLSPTACLRCVQDPKGSYESELDYGGLVGQIADHGLLCQREGELQANQKCDELNFVSMNPMHGMVRLISGHFAKPHQVESPPRHETKEPKRVGWAARKFLYPDDVRN